MKYAVKNWINKQVISNRPISKAHFIKLALGLFILISLITYNPSDPNPFNLLQPAEGIHNWLGLPGALFSGLLIDFLGYMSYLFPVFILLLTRQNSILHPKHFLPDLLEILVIAALVANLSETDPQVGIKMVGVWGYVSVQAISQFPGGLYVLVILFCFQIFYFKSIRLDLSLFTISWTAILIFLGVLGQIFGNGIKIFKKSVKYISINWLSPLTLVMAKSSEKTRESLKSRYRLTRRKIEDVNLADKASSTMERVFGNKEVPDDTAQEFYPIHKEFEKQMLARVIKKYRKTLYISDSKSFLKLEEEI